MLLLKKRKEPLSLAKIMEYFNSIQEEGSDLRDQDNDSSSISISESNSASNDSRIIAFSYMNEVSNFSILHQNISLEKY
jgi:hypothetical protein